MSGVRDVIPQVRGDLGRHARLAVAAVVIVSFAWGGVQLVDPLPKAAGAEPVSLSAPPARIAYGALVQTDHGSFVVEGFVGNDTSLDRVYRLRYDAADRQLRGTLSPMSTGPGVAVYASDAGVWRRSPSDAGSWVPTPPEQIGTTPTPFSEPEAVLERGADVSVLERNASAVVVRVNDTDTAALVTRGWEDLTAVAGARASLTLVVARETGMVRRIRYRQSRLVGPEGNETRRVVVAVYRFRRWGEVDVRAPRGLPYTFDSVLWDLLDLCPECEGMSG